MWKWLEPYISSNLVSQSWETHRYPYIWANMKDFEFSRKSSHTCFCHLSEQNPIFCLQCLPLSTIHNFSPTQTNPFFIYIMKYHLNCSEDLSLPVASWPSKDIHPKNSWIKNHLQHKFLAKPIFGTMEIIFYFYFLWQPHQGRTL